MSQRELFLSEVNNRETIAAILRRFPSIVLSFFVLFRQHAKLGTQVEWEGTSGVRSHPV